MTRAALLARKDAVRHMLASGERLQTIRLSAGVGMRTINRVVVRAVEVRK